jgi:uncharacterized membrane protein
MTSLAPRVRTLSNKSEKLCISLAFIIRSYVVFPQNSLQDQSHTPTNEYNRFTNCTQVLKTPIHACTANNINRDGTLACNSSGL